MQETTYLALQPRAATKTKVRDVVAILFRQRKLLALSFLGTLLGAVLAILVIPDRYQAEMKVMLQRNRQNTAVTPDPIGSVQQHDVTEQEVNSEVDMMKSRDLLKEVVLATNMQNQTNMLRKVKILLHADDPVSVRTENAVNSLAKYIEIDPPMKSNMITALYPNSNPKLAANVLNSLAKLYVDKHLSVHKGPETAEMFQKEAAKYQAQLIETQQKLADFNNKEQVISAQAEKDAALQKVSQFESQYRETQVQIAATQERIRGLQEQSHKTEARRVTQVRTPSMLLESLNSTLYGLQLKRTELLQKYSPNYRPVQDIDKQIEETKNAIKTAQSSPLQETTTDGNPTFDWIMSELAKSRAELAGLRAQADANKGQVGTYRAQAESFERKGIPQAELERAEKQAENNYALYIRKAEEARLSDALDEQRIVNTAVAEWAYVPSVPVIPLMLKLFLSVLLAGMVSVGLVFARDYWDPSFRTPNEVQSYLNVSVIAAIPQGDTLLIQTQNPKLAEAAQMRSA